MLYTLFFFSLQNAVCFIMLTFLVPVLFTFYIQGVLKLEKKKFLRQRVNRPVSKADHWLPPPPPNRVYECVVWRYEVWYKDPKYLMCYVTREMHWKRNQIFS